MPALLQPALLAQALRHELGLVVGGTTRNSRVPLKLEELVGA